MKPRQSNELNPKERLAADTEKRKQQGTSTSQGFLDVGSVSWSLLIAAYFLSLHKAGGVSTWIDQPAQTQDLKFCMTFESILEMLEVLQKEFDGMVPLETSPVFLGA